MTFLSITRVWRIPIVCATLFVVGPFLSSVGAAESDWSRANRTVDEAGGWKAYLRESQAAQAGSQATAFRPDRSPADRTRAWRDFSQAVDLWLGLAMDMQPGLRQAMAHLAGAASADASWLVMSEPSRAALASSLRVSRPLLDDVIAWAYAQEHHQRLSAREDLADVAWELAQRMHGVGNLPLQEERAARLHLVEIRATRQKAQLRLLSAREALAQRLRAVGAVWPAGATLVLPLPPSARQPAEDGIAREALGRVATLISAETRMAVSARALRSEDQPRAHPYPLAQAYAGLTQAEGVLQLASARVQLLVDEGLNLRQTISEEHLLAYNGMLIGTPKLLKDRDEAMVFELEVLEALRDYWLARSRRDHMQASVLLEEIFWGVAR